MEGSHLNGVAENEATNSLLPIDTSIAGSEVNGHDEQQRATMTESSTEAVEEQKQSFKFVVKTKTSVSSTEDDTGGNENETEETKEYVIRSQTSVESSEETKDNPREPPSNAKLKFKVRTQSTEEHSITEAQAMEKTDDKNGTTNDVFNDIGETQTEEEKEIAAKASEIVATILEKLDDEERSKEEQVYDAVDEKSNPEPAPDDVTVALAEVEKEQQIPEDKKNKAEVEVMKFETNDEEEVEKDQTVDVEAIKVEETASHEDKDQVQEEKVAVMTSEWKKEKEEEQEMVDVETKTEEMQAAAIAVSSEQHTPEDQEGKNEVVAMKFESREEAAEVEETAELEAPPAAAIAVLEGEQPSGERETKAEVLAMQFDSREERTELEETAEVEEAANQVIAAVVAADKEEEEQPSDEQTVKDEVVAMKFESREETVEVETKVDVEAASEEVPTEFAAAQGEQVTNEDQEDKADVVTMTFEKRDEEIELQQTVDVEVTAPEVQSEEVAAQATNEDQEDKADVATMTFEKKDEEVEVEEMAEVDTAPLEAAAAVEATKAKEEPQQTTEVQEHNAEVVAMEFESKEENVEVEETVDEVEAPAVAAAAAAAAEAATTEKQQPSEDKERQAEVIAVKFESKEERTEVEETTDKEEEAPKEVPLEAVATEEEEQPSEVREGKGEVLSMTFESREEKVEVEETAQVEAAQKEIQPMPAAAPEEQQAPEEKEEKTETDAVKFGSREEKIEVEETAEVDTPTEIVPTQREEKPIEDQEEKEEVIAMKYESEEENGEVEERVGVEVAQAGMTVDEEANAEIVAMKFESSEENATKEETAFEEASEAKVFVDAVRVEGEAAENNEDQLSPKQEYVAERFLYKPQSQHEIQDQSDEEDTDESEEKPIIKVRVPEEPYQTDLNEKQNDFVEVHGTEVQDTEEIITPPDHEFESQPEEAIKDRKSDEEENDSEGEIEVKIRRFSQENQELIHDQSDDDEDSPVDWMAKDDVDEVVFRGETLSPTSFQAREESENQKQIDQPKGPAKKEDSHILVESGGRIFIDDVVVPDTREVQVCSGLENMFAPEELQDPEKFNPRDSMLDYDIDKDIEADRKRLESDSAEKRVVQTSGNDIEVHEEVLANEVKRREVSNIDINLMDEEVQGEEVRMEDEEEVKPPSPLEAKEVKEKGIQDIFEAETYRRSGEFLSPVHEIEEDTKDKKFISERKGPVADEEALHASELEKRCSLEWSLLDKWKEMEQKAKRESLELEESKGETKVQPETIQETESEQPEIVLDVSDGKESESRVTEYEIRERHEPEVTVTETTETTPSSVSKVTTTKTVTKTRIIKARTEVQPEIQTDEFETPSKDEETPQEEVPQSTQEDQEPKAPSQELEAPMSTILFRMDGTPIIIQPEPSQAKIEENPVEEAPEEKAPENEAESEPQLNSEEAAPMSTILFKMDGTPIVIPPAKKEDHPSSPKPKAVVFSGVRPQSLASVESVRGEHEGVPPLAGEEESDIDDSSLHLAKHAPGASRAPTVSPLKEVTSTEKEPHQDERHEAESPLLDNSANLPGQKCCVIL